MNVVGVNFLMMQIEEGHLLEINYQLNQKPEKKYLKIIKNDGITLIPNIKKK